MVELRSNIHIGTRVAPLGLRFWDVPARAYVGDGLEVTAFPSGHERLSVTASPSPSGVWVFHHLPGLAAFERALAPGATQPSAVDDQFWSSPDLGADTRPFAVRVTDKLGRYLPFEIPVDAPVKGIFAWPVPGATGLPAGPGGAIPLFPGPARKVPPGMAVLRADLSSPPATATDEPRPAAWALLRASLGASHLAWGLSDEEGRATLIFPYPAATSGVGTPPPLSSRTWDITLSAWHTPPAPDTDIPERAALSSVLAGPARPLWKQWGAGPADRVPLGAVQLRYGEELAVTTEGARGRLWLG